MRCPECNHRNSVAAKQCGECGFAFPKRQFSNQTKLIVGFAVSLLFLWGVALAVVPRLNDPTLALQSSAKAFADNPGKDDKEQILRFDRALQAYLKQAVGLSSSDLTKRLQSILPNSLFEINVFNLPKGLKLVEIDAGLKAFDYLLYGGTTDQKVLALKDLDVFENSTVINDPNGTVLVLLGHSAGQLEHRPQIKVFAMPAGGDLKDESDRVVPKLPGNGDAVLSNNKIDVIAKISLLSLARQEGLFDDKALSSSPVSDEILPYALIWKDGSYSLHPQAGNGQLATLSKVARWAKKLNKVPAYDALLDEDSKRAFESEVVNPDDTTNSAFTISRSVIEQSKKGTPKVTFMLNSAQKRIKTQLSKSGSGWQVVALEVAESGPALSSVAPVVEAGKEASGLSGTEKAAQLEKAAESKAPDLESAAKSEPKSESVQEPESKPGKYTAEAKNEQSQETETPESTPTTETSSTTSGTTPSVMSKANMRSGPGTEFQAVSALDPNTPLIVMGKKEGWYHVKADGKEGYVYGGLVNYKKSDAFTTATIKKDKPVADQQNHSLGAAHKGDRIVVLGGIQNNKYKVQLSNGKVGYVDKDALDVTVDAPQFVP
jgi:hypothetical protein